MDGQTVLTKVIEYEASSVTAGGNNKELMELRAMMKKLTALVTAQAATLAALSFKTHSGGGGSKKKHQKEESVTRIAHVCTLQEGGLSQGRKLLGVSNQQGQALHRADKRLVI